ncbi:MAG: hypothetical protein DDT28_01238 [Dehalococcoidia bacterium]|nr:hypothetical protein [Chloroflexota bacterium]MBT9161394.1 hypothetical protein [Chloroflexota bacterium]
MGSPESLSQYWLKIQKSLFPWLEEELGALTEKQQQLVTTLELVRIEKFIPGIHSLRGRPPKERRAIGRAFVAKAVYNMPTTRDLLERLSSETKLRRICGWEKKGEIPSESTFSRAFAEFSQTQLTERVHAALIDRHLSGEIIGHISRDSTKIEAREKPQKKAESKAESNEEKPNRKRGRPKKGEERVKEPTRLERQKTMTLEEMLEELPKGCDVGTKKNSQGYKETWIGYKFHIDTGDRQIPISCILTSASTHDSQAALPLAAMTNQRVTNLYDLMDSAYDAPIIREYSQSLGHVSIIDINPRGNAKLKEELRAEAQCFEFLHLKRPEDCRYKERTSAERVNGRLKDEFGGKMVRVRGHAKIMTHLMFGILALVADQLIRLVA